MIVDVTGPVSYVVQIEGGRLVRRYIDQMRKREVAESSNAAISVGVPKVLGQQQKGVSAMNNEDPVVVHVNYRVHR